MNSLNFYNYYYFLLLIFIYFLGYYLQKKTIVKSFSILYLGFFLWTLLLDSFYTNFSFIYGNFINILSFLFLSTIIFVGTLGMLVKSLPKNEENFIKKFLLIPTLFLKFIVFIFLLSLTTYFIVSVSSSKENSFLLSGIIFLVASLLLPKILNFSEDKSEIITFIIGILSLNYFFIETFDLNSTSSLIISFVFYAIFIGVWYFRPSRAFDYFFIPATYLLFNNFLSIYYGYFNYLMNFNKSLEIFLFLGCLVIISNILFYEKIQNSVHKNQINRIFNGNELVFFIFILYDYFHFSYYFNISGDTINFLFILNILIFFTCLLTIIKGTKKEKNLKLTLALMVIVVVLNYLCLNLLEFNFMIMLILLNIFKNNKTLMYFFSISLVCFIIEYYYDTQSTLFDKSLSLSFIAIFLLSSYLISKYLSNGDECNE